MFLALPDPADLRRTVDAAQLVTARYGDQTVTFEGQISATPERFLLVAVDPLGRKALTITWSNASINYAPAAWLPLTLRPENMLADLFLIYWPEDVVRAGVSASGGVLTTGSHGRSIALAGREVIDARFGTPGSDPWAGVVEYRNFAWNYALRIQSVVTSL